MQVKDILNCISLDISRVTHALPSISRYLDPEFYPCVIHLTPDTNKPIDSSWYLSRLSSQVLTRISFVLSHWPCDVFHKWEYCTSNSNPRWISSTSSYKSCKNLLFYPSAKNARVQISIEWLFFWPLTHTHN